jgi:autophagy-related protein 16-1
MSGSGMNTANIRQLCLEGFKKRNNKENEPFYKLIKSHNKLIDVNNNYKSEIEEIKQKNQKLQQDNLELLKSPGAFSANTYPHEKLRYLDEQLLKTKDEVIDLQKRLVEQAQQVILLNRQLKEKNEEMVAKDLQIVEIQKRLQVQINLNRDLDKKIMNYEEIQKLYKDEKFEAEIQYNCLLKNYNKLKDDHQQVLTASLRFREEQIETMNKLNEQETIKSRQKLKDDLEKASQPTSSTDLLNLNQYNIISVGPMNSSLKQSSSLMSMPLVNKASYKFDCNDGEVNSVKFHKSGKYFATGGGDRKIKLWEYKDGKAEFMSSLIGSNASIASIDIDNENNLISGTSFDFACRLWSLNEHRLRMSSGDLQPTHTLTGHTNKVLSGKFLGLMKIVTGSYDRTLKVWDLIQKACIKTLFVGSSCNDLVTLDSQSIISCHLDKKIRFWDARTDLAQSEILLQGKITSLDVSPSRPLLLLLFLSCNYLISSLLRLI